MAAGKRNTLITLQRATMVKDDHGGETPSWAEYCEEWASVSFGSGQERREAAQESATQTATFRVLAHPLTLALAPTDRVAGYLGANWDITDVAPYESEVAFTAVRKAA